MSRFCLSSHVDIGWFAMATVLFFRFSFSAQDINGMAERALLRLGEKLDGKYLSRSEAYSVEAHVEFLIQEAMNLRNLSQLFAGWQAYL